MNRAVKYTLLGVVVVLILVLVVTTLERTEIHESNAVVTVIGGEELNIEIDHPSPALGQKVQEFFGSEVRESEINKSIETIRDIETSLAERGAYLEAKKVEPGKVVNTN